MKHSINNQTVQRRSEPQMDKHLVQSQGVAQRKPAPTTSNNRLTQLKKAGETTASDTAVVQRVGDPPPTGKDLGDMATGFFNLFPFGASPKIQQVYGMKDMQAIRQQPTGLISGWEYGKKETELLKTLPTTGDTKADTLARSKFASTMRPLAGALGGALLSFGHYNYEAHKNGFVPPY